MPELSSGSENDMVHVPNIPLLAAFTKAADLDGFKTMAFQAILMASKPKEFQQKTVQEYLFGYTDAFITTTPDINPDRVGLIAGRRGKEYNSKEMQFDRRIFQAFRSIT